MTRRISTRSGGVRPEWLDPASPYGPELVTNGDFSSATGWTLDGASISGGVLSRTSGVGSGALAFVEVELTDGMYHYSIDIVATSNSDVTGINFGITGGSVELPANSPPGTYADDIEIVGALNNTITISLGEGVTVVDNFSLTRS